MGDVRYDAALRRAEEARREGALDRLSAETGVQALGALAAEDDPLLANVLATRLLNQLRRSATLLRFVAEGVVALDSEGRVLFANPAAEEMLGWAEGALVGRDFHETVRHAKADGGRVPREACALLRVLHGEVGRRAWVDDHDTFQRADGSTFLVGFSVGAITHAGEPTGIAVAFRDITREKQHEAILALHHAALDAVPIPVFWLGRDGAVLYANEAAALHLGRSPEELTRMRVFDFDVDFPPDRWEAHWQEVKSNGIMRFGSRHRTRSGDLVPVALRVQHVEHEGHEFHVAVAQRRDAM